MRSLGIITARGSSKRLPRKVLRTVNGVPMIAFMCRAALASGLTRVVVSTEDEEIMAVCREWGVEAPFCRPAALAEDYAEDCDIVDHALTFCEEQEGRPYDVVVKLQPTTPFVLAAHIDGCLTGMADPATNCCFTARRTTEPPQWMFKQNEDGSAGLLLNDSIEGAMQHSQLLPPSYFPTGAAYAIRPAAMRALRRIYCEPLRMVAMEAERSVDVDTELDLLYADLVARHQGFGPVPAKVAP